MSEISKWDEARRALKCLYLEVPKSIADDVSNLVHRAFNELKAENEKLKDLAKSIHGTAAIDLIDKLNARIDNQKAIVEDRGNQINQLTADRDQWKAKAGADKFAADVSSDLINLMKQRIEKMSALLERMPHSHAQSIYAVKDGVPDCPACARDKLREEMK